MKNHDLIAFYVPEILIMSLVHSKYFELVLKIKVSFLPVKKEVFFLYSIVYGTNSQRIKVYSA
jgi:hypothetical protein